MQMYFVRDGGAAVNFHALLGNEPIKKGLKAAAAADKFSHFYLLSGPKGSGRHTLARLLAAAMLCTGAGEAPCGACPQCRKALAGIHPDVIFVDDPEKKTVPVELIRQAREDMFIRPNEGKRKIYIIPRGQDLGLPGQNALLKVLEEPPTYGAFLLLTDNPEKLLPTVRSRCTELRLLPLPADILLPALRQRFPQASPEQLASAMEEGEGFLGAAAEILENGGSILPQTERFAAVYGAKDTLGLLELLTSLEKYKRDKLIECLTQWRQLLLRAMRNQAGGQEPASAGAAISASRSPKELYHAAVQLAQAIHYAQGNVSPAAICGQLVWALR